ncbi:HNH endonuclease signature motif containing protein [Aeromonas media]|uniref:HNH endonuclease signature motif containing protein n=1 Tax=Aeromonas media TaxID=651 RepID=UPI0038D211C3
MKRKCKTSGCSAICDIENVYCSNHKRLSAPRRAFDTDEIYKTSRWIRISKALRAEYPICRVCGKHPSTLVDHIYEIRWAKGEEHAFMLDNLMSSCYQCHAIKTKAIARTIRNNNEPTTQTYQYLRQYCQTMEQLSFIESTKAN